MDIEKKHCGQCIEWCHAIVSKFELLVLGVVVSGSVSWLILSRLSPLSFGRCWPIHPFQEKSFCISIAMIWPAYVCCVPITPLIAIQMNTSNSCPWYWQYWRVLSLPCPVSFPIIYGNIGKNCIPLRSIKKLGGCTTHL